MLNIHIGYLIGRGSLLDGENRVSIKDFSKKGKFDFLSIFKIRRYVNHHKIDIIHSHLLQSSINNPNKYKTKFKNYIDKALYNFYGDTLDCNSTERYINVMDNMQ